MKGILSADLAARVVIPSGRVVTSLLFMAPVLRSCGFALSLIVRAAHKHHAAALWDDLRSSIVQLV